MPKTQSLHLLTLNVRYDTHSSQPVPIPVEGHIPPKKQYPWQDPYAEHPWAERRSRLVDAIFATGPVDIIGFQEVLHNQLLDLQELLGQGFGSVGVGRDDGKEKGEYSPIFYDKDKFEVVRWKTVWLSPTPEVPGSVGWDASQTRIATLLTLSALTGPAAGDLIHVVNTHYDDAGVKARAESSLIIRQQTKRWVERFEDPDDPIRHRTAPVILLGDFNSPPSEDGYKNITSSQPTPSGRPCLTYLDTYAHLLARNSSSPLSSDTTAPVSSSNNSQLSIRTPNPAPSSPLTPSLSPIGGFNCLQSGVYGPNSTYSGFTRPGKTHTARIDFIMLATEHEPEPTPPPSASPYRPTRATMDQGETDEPVFADPESPLENGGMNKVRGGFTVVRYGVVDNWLEEGDATGWYGRWSDHRAVRVTIERNVE